jgi:dihydroorotate dehydrogenase electron transfer subunit
MSARAHRGTIHLEEARILAHEPHPANQFVLRVEAPETAKRAVPGTFCHIQCAPSVPLRRPLSIMQADSGAGWVEFLYKPVGTGLAQLSARPPGECISVLGPIGNGFMLDPAKPRVLALGGGVGIPPMIFLAQTLRGDDRFDLTVFAGSEIPFPFATVPATRVAHGIDATATHAAELLQQWGIVSHLASRSALTGAYRGFVTDLAAQQLRALSRAERRRTQIVACGPEPMLAAAARLAREQDVSCQLALEEYMACGVGGCAGCTVLIQTQAGPAMKRVCVDGPVFPAEAVYPAA